MENKKKKKGFPDLNKDGKVTFKDILIGRGVIKGNVGLLIKKGAEKGIKELSKSDKIKDIVEKGMKKGKDELIKASRRATPPEPASELRDARRSTTRNILLGSGLTSAGLGIAGAKIEERDFKKARQAKETKERTETEGSFMGGGMMNEDPMGYKTGGAIEVGKGKDYIKDLL